MKEFNYTKFLLFSCLLSISSTSIAMEKKKAITTGKFIFTTFQNKTSCEQFISKHISVPFLPPLMLAIGTSHAKPPYPEDRAIFKKKCTEAARFLIHEDNIKVDEGDLFLTINPDVLVLNKIQPISNAMNAELAVHFLDLGADPFKKVHGNLNFEDIVDTLYLGFLFLELPPIKSNNCDSDFDYTTELMDIIRVRTEIKKIRICEDILKNGDGPKTRRW